MLGKSPIYILYRKFYNGCKHFLSMKKRATRSVSLQRRLVILAFIILVLAAILFAWLASQKIPKKSFECKSDKDCAKVQTSCCSCSMGGEEICAPLSKSAELKAKDCPSDLMCVAMYNCNIKSCACINGKCEGIQLE